MRFFLIPLALCIPGASSFLPIGFSSKKSFQFTETNGLHYDTSFVQTSAISNGGRTSTRSYVDSRKGKITALPMVWWFGGSQNVDENADNDSCELVAVRIEKTSSNSRRILGEITIPNVPMDAVWSILTDYDNLAIHVPNLVESKIIQRGMNGRPGDGQYQCRLYQKGAQKIIGFEFGASVTMDMKEAISASQQKINFKCYDSFFFQEFDGEWKVHERPSSSFTNGDNTNNNIESVLSYVVDVRPKGPVPVAALEWRIREDVPTNLRAVKKAAVLYEMNRQRQIQQSNNNMSIRNQITVDIPVSRNGKNKLQQHPVYASQVAQRTSLARDTRLKVQWYKDETMDTYLSDQ